MVRIFRHGFGRALCVLAVFGLLASATPGCGDSPQKNSAAQGGVPATVKESNKNMEDFMKSQKKK